MTIRSVKADQLHVGDTMALPMGRTATIERILVTSPRSRYVQLWTEHGKTRLERSMDVLIEAPEAEAL